MTTARGNLAAALLCVAATATATEPPRRLPPITPAPAKLAAHDAWAGSYASVAGEPGFALPFEVGAKFNKGVFIRAREFQQNPYALYVGGRLQLRYTGFSRDVETFTDNAGVTNPVRNRSNFDAERVRLNISGTALSPKLTYNFIFDADSDGASQVDGLAYFFTYAFDPKLRVRLGRWKVAADRQWLLSSRYLRFADRSLATEYFRVGFSDGLWLLGNLDGPAGGRWRYEASLTNGLRTSTRAPSNLDDNLAAAGTLYCDPLGPYGDGTPDYLWHDTPVVRFGASFAFDKSDDRSDAGGAFALGDDSFLRLSDGTRLADTGALAPGVTLRGDRVLLAAIDVGIKYRGWSASAEYFLRSLQDLTADGALPVNKLYDYGFHAELGKFVVERKLDLNFRMSQVSGLFGNSFEYAGGMNYYFGEPRSHGGAGDQLNKFTFDVTNIIQSSVDTTTADIFAGDDGLLVRAQVQIGF
ncbi:MAG: porin [Planctomycetota bacterium]